MGIFNFIHKTKTEDFSLEALKKDIILLEDSEKHIWNLHTDNDLENLFKDIEGRNSYIINLNSIVSNILKNQNELKSELKSKNPMFNIEFKEIYSILENDLKLLVNISKSQIELLNQSSYIFDKEKRESVLNGEKLVKDLSQISSTIKSILEKIEKELSSIPENIDNRTNKIKERFEIRENTIYDRTTKLEWEKDFSKRGEMDWDSAMKINDNNFKLPSIEDFRTLNINNNNDGYPIQKDLKIIGFENVQGYYWTTKTDNDNTFYAWLISLYGGHDGTGVKTFNYYVACLRRQ